jgi:hypothetical protein
MVWLLPAAESGRVSIIIIITYLIGLAGFNHVVAGSTKLLLLVVNGAETWKHSCCDSFFPHFWETLWVVCPWLLFWGMLKSSRERIRIEPAIAVSIAGVTLANYGLLHRADSHVANYIRDNLYNPYDRQ